MIVRLLTSLPLVGLAALWWYAALAFARGGNLATSSVLLATGLPLLAGAATSCAVWRFREPTGERAAGRILLAVVDGFCLLVWAGSIVGWGGGV